MSFFINIFLFLLRGRGTLMHIYVWERLYYITIYVFPLIQPDNSPISWKSFQIEIEQGPFCSFRDNFFFKITELSLYYNRRSIECIPIFL